MPAKWSPGRNVTDKWSFYHSTANPAQFFFKTVEGDTRGNVAGLNLRDIILHIKPLSLGLEMEIEKHTS